MSIRKFMMIGKVVEKLAPKVSLVEVQTNELDRFISMYFARYQEHKVDDGPYRTKVNDYVLIRVKEKPERLDLLHEVSEVVIRAGQMRDPFTGERVVGDAHRIDFVKDLDKINAAFPDHVDRSKVLNYTGEDVTIGTHQSRHDKM